MSVGTFLLLSEQGANPFVKATVMTMGHNANWAGSSSIGYTVLTSQ